PAEWILRADCLRSVFDHIKLVMPGDLLDRLHLAAQTKQMDWNNCPDFFPAFCFQFTAGMPSASFLEAFPNCRCTDIVGDRIDIDKKRSRANPRNASAGGKKCIRRCHNSISGPDSKRRQNGQESIRPR